MKKVPLGNSGLQVSKICLGAMNFGSQTDQTIVNRILDVSREYGVNFIDSADVYADGASEVCLGKAIAHDREDWVVASKVGYRSPTSSPEIRLDRRYINSSLDASLLRLNTDYLDLYYLHAEDPITPLEHTLEVIGSLLESKKIRYFGLSNFSAWKIAEVVGLCTRMEVPTPIAVQPCYNLLTRMAETECLPACSHFDISTVVYSPLARGVLTGKYKEKESVPEDSRAHRSEKRFVETEYRPESIQIAQKVKVHAEIRGMNLIEFSIAWVLGNALVTCVIAGPKTLDQWMTYIQSSEKLLNRTDEIFIDNLVAPGHSSTHYYTDPNFPVIGRDFENEY